MNRLSDRYLQAPMVGRIEWMGLRPARREAMIEVASAQALAERGLEGDRRCAGTPGSARQITLINKENIELVACMLGREAIEPGLLRRNLVVSGINLLALRHQQFRIGDVMLEGTAACHPCGRMEEALGPGGFAAMLGHGGLCARILSGGEIAVGDEICLINP